MEVNPILLRIFASATGEFCISDMHNSALLRDILNGFMNKVADQVFNEAFELCPLPFNILVNKEKTS